MSERLDDPPTPTTPCRRRRAPWPGRPGSRCSPEPASARSPASRPSASPRPVSGRSTTRCSWPRRRPTARTRPSSGAGTSTASASRPTPSPTPATSPSPSSSGCCPRSSSSRRTSTGCTSAPARPTSSSFTAACTASAASTAGTAATAGRTSPTRTEKPPRCPECGDYLRPEVVWFGEGLPPDALGAAQQLSAGCDVMLIVGTSGVVYPAAAMPMIAQEAGATVIDVNPERDALSRMSDVFLQGPGRRGAARAGRSPSASTSRPEASQRSAARSGAAQARRPFSRARPA